MTRASHDELNTALRRAAGRTVHAQDAEPAWDHDDPDGSRQRRRAWLGLDDATHGSADGGAGRNQPHGHAGDMNRLIRAAAGKE